MADPLTKYGIYIDDFSKILILEPEVANQSNKLKEESQNFVSSKSRCHAVSISDVNQVTLVLLSLSPDLYWQCGSFHCPLSLCVCIRYLFDEYLREKNAHSHTRVAINVVCDCVNEYRSYLVDWNA